MEWKEFEKRKVFVRLTNGSVFNAEVLEVDDRNPICVFITILDKYNEVVTISNNEIALIKVVK